MGCIIDKLHKELEEKAAPSRKKYWLNVLKDNAQFNINLPMPNIDNGLHQQIIKLNDYISDISDGYLLRTFDRKQEIFRVKFTSISRITEFLEYGTSGVFAFRRILNNGYSFTRLLNIKTKIINQTDLFPYLDLSKVNLNAYILLSKRDDKNFIYALEILIKTKQYKLAELFCNFFSYVDIKKALKHNSKLLSNPSYAKLEFASKVDFTYEIGMMQCNIEDIYSVLKLTKWNKFRHYAIKQKFDLKTFIIDYLDYRKDNKEYNLPNWPNDFYEAKQKLIFYMNREVEATMKVDNAYIDHKITNLNLPSVENDKYIIEPFESSFDLFIEGKTLNHCVYNYKDSFAEGKTKLFKLRHKNKPNTPYVTIEIKNKTISQVRGKNNSDKHLLHAKEINALKSALLD